MRAAASFLSLILGTASALPFTERDNDLEPCAQISQLAAGNTSSFPADLTLSCLRSVPLAKKDNLVQLSGLKAFVEFQSDLTYLRDPPVGRLYPPVDILAGLDVLTSLLQGDAYGNEYDFQLDVFKIFSSAYDGHFLYVPDIIGVFSFNRLHDNKADHPGYFSLISVLKGDDTIPSVFAYSDEAALRGPSRSDYTASPIAKINGEDVVGWLNSCASQNGRSQDPDANYNSLFLNIPTIASTGIATTYFTNSRFYQGNDTEVTFANGTSRNVATVARSEASFEGVTDGASFFKKFCSNELTDLISTATNTTSQNNSSQSSGPTTQVPYEPIATAGVAPPHPAYPSPIVIASNASVAGYLSETRQDLAVLSIPSFGPVSVVEFENTVRQLLATAQSNNRNKLVIDLCGNPGGDVFLAYDLFRQLFPDSTPYGAGNYRANELHNFTGQLVSENIDTWQSQYPDLLASINAPVTLSSFNYRKPLTPDGGKFDSWDDFFGPHKRKGDNFTSLNRWNLTEVSASSIPILGYGNDTETRPQTFAPENIILLQDGYCASTCAVFSEFMRSQKSVRSVVVGGRPQIGPMQGVGGVKGSQEQGMLVLFSIISTVLNFVSIGEQLAFTAKFGIDLLGATTKALSRAHPSGSASVIQAGINFRNNIREGDASVTPLQHVYEAADCRFFYTAEMYASQAAVWDRAYDSMWAGAECVEGSTGHASANISTVPPKEASNFFGGNNTLFIDGALGSALRGNASASQQSSSGGNDNNGNGGGSNTTGNGSGDDKKNRGAYMAVPWPSTSCALLIAMTLTL